MSFPSPAEQLAFIKEEMERIGYAKNTTQLDFGDVAKNRVAFRRLTGILTKAGVDLNDLAKHFHRTWPRSEERASLCELRKDGVLTFRGPWQVHQLLQVLVQVVAVGKSIVPAPPIRQAG